MHLSSNALGDLQRHCLNKLSYPGDKPSSSFVHGRRNRSGHGPTKIFAKATLILLDLSLFIQLLQPSNLEEPDQLKVASAGPVVMDILP